MHHSLHRSLLLLACTLSCIPAETPAQVVAESSRLTAVDRFEIFTQMNLHQAYIDLESGCDNSKLYASLYWPDCTFHVMYEKSGRNQPFHGLKGVRQIFDYAHSVFPLYQWQHSMGIFEISETDVTSSAEAAANARWKWRVDWKANTTGVVSTGYYNDVFEKRDGLWKVLKRTSTDDPNWPIEVCECVMMR